MTPFRTFFSNFLHFVSQHFSQPFGPTSPPIFGGPASDRDGLPNRPPRVRASTGFSPTSRPVASPSFLQTFQGPHVAFDSRFYLLFVRVPRPNIACGWSSNALNALASRVETQFANRDGNGMLHIRWKKKRARLAAPVRDRASSKQAATWAEGGEGVDSEIPRKFFSLCPFPVRSVTPSSQ